MPIMINPRNVDLDVIVDGARTALLASPTIPTLLNTATYPKRIANEVIDEGITPPYIVLAVASAVFASSYNDPAINALLDLSCYAEGDSTGMVRALMKASLLALIDTPWTIPGMTKISANMEEGGTGFRNVTAVVDGIITRGRQCTLRVRALNY